MEMTPINDRESSGAGRNATPITQPRGDLPTLSPEVGEAYNPARSEMAMWAAVITQALMDAASNSAKPEARAHKEEARRWLLGGSEDFATVCDYAGYDPGYVRRRAREALARNCRWRAETKNSPPRPAFPPVIFTKSLNRPAPPAVPRRIHAFA